MINSKVEELEFLMSLMSDLEHNYPDHNKKVLSDIIQSVKYKRDCEVKQQKHRFIATA